MNCHWSVTNENQFVWIFDTTGSLSSDWILYLEGTNIGTQNGALVEKPFLAAPPNLASSNKQPAMLYDVWHARPACFFKRYFQELFLFVAQVVIINRKM